MKKEKKELSYFNLFLIVMGIIFLGELFMQIASRLGLEIPDLDYYLRLQFIVFTPLGMITYFATRARISKFISALLAVFSIYLINFTSLLVYTFDDPIGYFKENRKEILNAFTSNTLMLLPILIGFVVVEIANILLPKILKGRSLREVLLKASNGAVKKAKDLVNNKAKTVSEKKKETAKTETKKKKSTAGKSKNASQKKRRKGKKAK